MSERRDPIAEARRQWSAHGWDDVADGMAAVTSITRVQAIFQQRIDAGLRDLDLTFARYEILQLLAFSSRGALPMAAIGRRLQVHPTSVTSAVDRLETQGFVERAPHPTDRRAKLATLTGEGRRVVKLATSILNDGIFADLGLTRTQTSALIDLLTIVRTAAGDL